MDPFSNNNNYIDKSKQDLFNAINADPFMGNDSQSDGVGGVGTSIFDNSADPFAQAGGNFGNMNQQPKQNDNAMPNNAIDIIIWILKNICITIINLCVGGFITLKECFAIVNKKSADDFAGMFKVMFITFGPLCLISLILLFLGINTDTTLAFVGVVCLTGSIMDLILTGAGWLTLSVICYKPQTVKDMDNMIDKEVSQGELKQELDEVVSLSSEYNQSFDDIMNEIMADPEVQDIGIEETSEEDEGIDIAPISVPDEPKEEKEIVADVPDNVAVISPEFLFNTFSPLFPAFNPKFADLKKFEEGSSEWEDLYAIVANIFADIYGCDMQGIVDKGIRLIDAENSIKCTRLVVKKPSGKLIDCSKIQDYFNNYAQDLIKIICDPKNLFTGADAKKKNLISASVTLNGDKYEIIIAKPCKDPILLGDVYKRKEVQEFMKNSKANTPAVIAVNDIGDPILCEISKKSQELYSALIGGGAGSGKSQFFASLAAQMVAFNQPKDLQMVLCDPKGDTLFNKLALCPHVCRLIQGAGPDEARDIYNMLRKMVSEEAPRRQAIFKQNDCANIQDYRKKGKEMPFIIVFIDEFLSVLDAMDQLTESDYKEKVEEYNQRKADGEKGLPKPEKIDYRKDTAKLMAVAVTKLRAAGIYFFIISHRFTGAVDKTTRTLTAFRCVLRSEQLKDEVFNPDELSSFTKKLVNAGDAAVKIGENNVDSAKAMMVSLDDDSTYKIFEAVAKGYYKMGATIPQEIKALGKGYQKDFERIKQELYGDEYSVKFDAKSIRDENNNGIPDDEEDLDISEDKKEINEDENSIDISENSEEDDKIESIDTDGTIHLKNENTKEDDSSEDFIDISNDDKKEEIEEPVINDGPKLKKEINNKKETTETEDEIDWEA